MQRVKSCSLFIRHFFSWWNDIKPCIPFVEKWNETTNGWSWMFPNAIRRKRHIIILKWSNSLITNP